MLRSATLRRPARLLYRTFASFHHQVQRIEALGRQLPVVFHTPALERYAIDSYFRAASRYRSAEDQQRGLFPFEERALEAYFPTPPARLLVPGAGGGRELVALAKRGFTMDALEPVGDLVAAARRVVDPAQVRIEERSLQEWTAAPSGHYDGVFTGWGMWTHILGFHERIRALEAFRRACPRGPVLLSFWSNTRLFDQHERPEELEPLYPRSDSRIHQWTREWLRCRVLGRGPVERGTAWTRGMFVHLVTEPELHEEARLAGYELRFFEPDARHYAHAVLMPSNPAR
jgi:hypothetical protein